MAILCDTAMVPVRDSAELWVDVVSELFVPLECVPHHGAAFHGRPRDIIGFSPDRVSEITATRIPGGNGIGWAMAPFLKRLADMAVRDEVPPDEHRVVESVVDLVGSLCATVMNEDAGPCAHSRAELVLRIRAYIDSHLGEADLTPTRIAATHFISK